MLQKGILGIAINGLALAGVTYILPDIQYTGGLLFFIVGGAVMGILNMLVKPILKLLSLPIHVLTLGLSLLVLNGVIFWLCDKIIDAIAIQSVTLFIPSIKLYFIAGIIFGVVNWALHLIIHNK